MNLEITETLSATEEYVALRVTAGLSAKSLEAAKIGLPNSLYMVCIRDNTKLVGMGRVVGDGACNFEIVDVAVDPAYQGQGLGKQVMHHIDRYLQRTVLEGSYVSMIADEPSFYEKLGYRLTAPRSEGMTKKFLPQSPHT
ncbi:GNAT family N-acetyltransferase [Photobacterium ganghwense]|uniref:GCN5 family acetyltransferase n=1 Tax=Photobacterium ganghwense TaxID=320778 RepID=A0A0J1K7L6_9GAMM|nr:GNAT family N-acetyltransferase [Photobacterium ganghwense]KLV10332.1 GCN5 family acetyltransferase [Photobacterium ganghwense]PSU09775.1 N-acetyltransferase [Photobacterium ganghwense]QSV17022.1 GNAT family N-acetyltransferase [Photobacterium ganghwense]